MVEDNTAPVAPIIADAEGQCSVTVTAPTTTDVCDGSLITGTTTDPLSYTSQGTYVITWTFTDSSGNSSTVLQNAIVVSENVTVEISSDLADCNNDIAVKINMNQFLPAGTEGGTWIDVDNTGGLDGAIFTPYGVPVGDYVFTYIIQSGDCTNTTEVTMTVDDDCETLPCGNIEVHNAFSPNNDGQNDNFVIENLNDFTCYPTNSVEIYNRWGVLVFEAQQYDNLNKVFRGISEGRSTVNKSSELPTGTYFYILQYTTSEGETVKKDGYLYLSK
jgi:gliding motility-associated-like protein